MDVTLKKRKPVVGITGPNRGGVIAWFFTQRAVRKAGGKPIRITPANPCSIDLLDALIVGGGADLDPTLYGKTKTDLFPDIKDEEKTVRGKLIFLVSLIFYPFLYLLRKAFSLKSATLIDKARDQLEYKLLDDAFRKNIPILGICRGGQLLNVYFGGTLHQHLKGFYGETPQIRTFLPKKKIEITAGSRLSKILNLRSCKVNALHHQAIKTVGEGCKAVARETNGIIQAIEYSRHPFTFGVQWHPEYLPQRRTQRALFEALVKEAHKESELTSKKPLRTVA